MVIPVTTKPFLHSFNFILLPWESLHFFSLIKEKINQIFTSCENGNHGYEPNSKLWSSYPSLCGIVQIITSLWKMEFNK